MQQRPWMMLSRWLSRNFFLDRGARVPTAVAKLTEIALGPLKWIMEPVRPFYYPETYYHKNIFERFTRKMQRALWSPVSKHRIWAFGIPIVCLVLFVGSLTTWLIYLAFIVVPFGLLPGFLTGLGSPMGGNRPWSLKPCKPMQLQCNNTCRSH